MHSYQTDFIRLALEHKVLRFGQFTLKSGRTSPYFFNSGLFNTGASLARLAGFYAAAIRASEINFDLLYGPAYKGIPLAAAVAVALSEHHDMDVGYCFNRKEVKDHGEKGDTVGAPLEGRVLIIDDVVSAGTSTRESLDIIARAGAQATGIAIALDRKERGADARSATEELSQRFHLQVIKIVDLDDLITYLQHDPGMGDALTQMQSYRARYGAN